MSRESYIALFENNLWWATELMEDYNMFGRGKEKCIAPTDDRGELFEEITKLRGELDSINSLKCTSKLQLLDLQPGHPQTIRVFEDRKLCLFSGEVFPVKYLLLDSHDIIEYKPPWYSFEPPYDKWVRTSNNNRCYLVIQKDGEYINLPIDSDSYEVIKTVPEPAKRKKK